MLSLKNISFSYSHQPFIEDLNFHIEKGKHVSIIGASGCGKSTLLQIIYGLHHVSGSISWNGKQLLGPNYNLVPGEDFIKYLSQDFDLMPPLSVAANVGKFLSNKFPRKKKQRIRQLLRLVEMEELADVQTRFLSGGQQQRVALARVLANEPEILLLDEPFSHIDHFRKNKLRRNLFSYLKQKEITCLVATHDKVDALSFADETLVLQAGKIVAQGLPKELYRNPKNSYVASLFGEINHLPARIFTGGRGRKKLILYPHEIRKSSTSDLKAHVVRSYFRGKDHLIETNIHGYQVLMQHATALKEGSIIGITVSEKILKSRTDQGPQL